MTKCVQRVAPDFDRIVVFSTIPGSYHGHPDPLTCPPDWSRRSLALYYYTNGRPAEEVSEAHSTVWKTRKGLDTPDPLRVRLGLAVREWSGTSRPRSCFGRSSDFARRPSIS